MKTRIYYIIFLSLFTLLSCSKENIMDKVSIVTYKVRCNNPIAHVQVFTKNNPIIIGEWSVTFITEEPAIGLTVRCLDDPLATITCELLYKWETS